MVPEETKGEGAAGAMIGWWLTLVVMWLAFLLGFFTAALLGKSDKESWVEFEGHDITPTEGGIIHHSTCWCKKAWSRDKDG